MVHVVVNSLLYSDTLIDDGTLTLKVSLLNNQKQCAIHLTWHLQVYHYVGEFDCQTTNHLQGYSREPRVWWSQDGSIGKWVDDAENNAITYKVSNLLCESLRGDDWLNMVLNVMN